MISQIKGRLVEKNPTYVIIDCNGIGYMLNISLNTYSKIKDKDDCKLFTHLIVREDALILFGFADEQERRLFRYLISVSGVGANTARLILSSLSPAEVCDAIVTDNVSALKAVKGIGNKSAQRIVIDLKDKLAKEEFLKGNLMISHNTKKEEALSGLIILGFNKNAANKALNKIFENKGASLSAEELIKEALKIL